MVTSALSPRAQTLTPAALAAAFATDGATTSPVQVTLLAAGHVGGVEPDSPQFVPGVRHPHVHVLAGPAKRHRLDALLVSSAQTIRAVIGTGALNVCSGMRGSRLLRIPCRPTSHGDAVVHSSGVEWRRVSLTHLAICAAGELPWCRLRRMS